MRRLVLILALAAAPAAAQDDARVDVEAIDVEAIELARDQTAKDAQALESAARDAQETLARLRTDLVEAAAAQGRAERQALELETQLVALDAEAATLGVQIAADEASLFEIAAALQRIERVRAPVVLTAPGDAADAARAARLLSALTDALAERTTSARHRVSALAALRADIAARSEALKALDEDLSQRRAAISTQAERTAALEASLRSNAQSHAASADALAAKASDLRSLIAELEALPSAQGPSLRPAFDLAPRLPVPRLRPDPAEARFAAPRLEFASQRFADAQGTLSPPATGAIAPAQPPRNGVTIATRRRAQVVAPFDARIDYAGLFRGYDGMLILDVGDGYHIILAGLSAVYGVSGQSVLAGEPLGEMPDERRPTPSLYFELRKDGAPIDPGPWLRG